MHLQMHPIMLEKKIQIPDKSKTKCYEEHANLNKMLFEFSKQVDK